MQLEIFQEIAQRSNQDGMTLPLQVHTFMSNKLKFCEKVQETPLMIPQYIGINKLILSLQTKYSVFQKILECFRVNISSNMEATKMVLM